MSNNHDIVINLLMMLHQGDYITLGSSTGEMIKEACSTFSQKHLTTVHFFRLL